MKQEQAQEAAATPPEPSAPAASSGDASDTKKVSLLWAMWAVLFCLPTWLSWLAGFHWFLELFVHFRLQYAVGLGLLLVPLLWKKQRILASMVGVTLLTNLIVVVPPLVAMASSAPPITSKTKTHKLLLANVLSSNRDHKALLALVKQEKPDAMVLLEIGDAWRDALRPLHKSYPYHKLHSRHDNFGIALFSKHKARHARVHSFSTYGEPSVSMQLRLGDQWLWLMGTHPVPPVGPRFSQARDEHMSNVAARMNQFTGPKILAGDFNVTSWSPAFRPLLTRSNLRDSRRGFGIQPTWMRHTLLFALPIDHILVSSEILVHKRWIGPDIGSDHRPVLMVFSIQPTPPRK